MTTRSKIQSTERMSNTGYHANGKPNWWARLGTGESARFVTLPVVRGDRTLECVVDLPPGTVVHIGAGKGLHKTVRETVTTTAVMPDEQEDGAEAVIAWHEGRLAETADKAPDSPVDVKATIGTLTPGRWTRAEVNAARRAEIARLRGAAVDRPLELDAAPSDPSHARRALEAERAQLLARLAEIESLLG